MDSKLAELVTQFVDSCIEHIAVQVQERQVRLIDECIDAKLSNYDPTEHGAFVDAVREAVDCNVMRAYVDDAIEAKLEDYDPTDAQYFGSSCVEAVRNELPEMVREVINDATFELVMR